MKEDKLNGIKPLDRHSSLRFNNWPLYLWKTWVRNKRAKQKLQTLLPNITSAVSDFDLLTNDDNYFSNFQERQLAQAKSMLLKAIPRFL